MFDVVWYIPALKDQALCVLKRIPEGLRHGLQMQGVYHIGRGDGTTFLPNPDGSRSDKLGRVTLCYFPGIGSAPFGICGTMGDWNKDKLHQLCDLVQIVPGLVGGKFKPEIWDRPEIKAAVEQGEKWEIDTLTKIEELTEKDLEENIVLLAAQMRYDADIIAGLFGVKLRARKWQFWRPTYETVIKRLEKSAIGGSVCGALVTHWRSVLVPKAHWRTIGMDMAEIEARNDGVLAQLAQRRDVTRAA